MTARLLCVVACSSVLIGCADDGAGESDFASGKAIVDANCKVCHAQAINGAPILGNIKMWAPRLKRSEDQMVANAINGLNGMMPPKGGNESLADTEIREAVRYMRHLATK